MQIVRWKWIFELWQKSSPSRLVIERCDRLASHLLNGFWIWKVDDVTFDQSILNTAYTKSLCQIQRTWRHRNVIPDTNEVLPENAIREYEGRTAFSRIFDRSDESIHADGSRPRIVIIRVQVQMIGL